MRASPICAGRALGLPRFRLVIGRIEVDFKRQMFYPGTATACARLSRRIRARCVIGQALFDGEGSARRCRRSIMVSLNEETHSSTPFDPGGARRARDDRRLQDGLPT
jgi:acyl-CoA thioester hydrolase